MINSKQKIVGISNWQLILKVIYRLFSSLVFFVIFWILTTVLLSGVRLTGEISSILTLITILIFMVGDVLYWKNSGIYVNQSGDHIVQMGGWVAKEDKLLNGVIISSQVVRGPIDQLLGMGTITTGMLGNKKLTGVRYSDIEKYDHLMRGNSGEKVSSIF